MSVGAPAFCSFVPTVWTLQYCSSRVPSVVICDDRLLSFLSLQCSLAFDTSSRLHVKPYVKWNWNWCTIAWDSYPVQLQFMLFTQEFQKSPYEIKYSSTWVAKGVLGCVGYDVQFVVLLCCTALALVVGKYDTSHRRHQWSASNHGNALPENDLTWNFVPTRNATPVSFLSGFKSLGTNGKAPCVL